jgi:hypothetical protein
MMAWVLCQANVHRTAHHPQAHLAYTAATFNVLIPLDRQLHPDAIFHTSITAFSF